jgi:signal transduction histidine kinase
MNRVSDADLTLIPGGSLITSTPEEGRALAFRIARHRAHDTAAEAREFPIERAITRGRWNGRRRISSPIHEGMEYRTLEDALQRSELLLAEMQRVSHTGTFSWRTSTDDVTFCAETARICGFDRGQHMTLALIAARVHPEERPLLYQMIADARELGSDLDGEFQYLVPGQAVKYVHMTARLHGDHDGRIDYVGVIQDITPRRCAEEALRSARSELTHATRVTTLGTLAASIAHEVSQPLAGILTNAALSLRFLAEQPPNIDAVRESVGRLQHEADRAAEVVAHLHALFGRHDTVMEAIDLNEATREVLALAMHELQRAEVTLCPELTLGLPSVAGDRVQLQQVILNLLLNASQAMKDVEDRSRQVVIRTEHDREGGVRLIVRDTGEGFGSRDIGKLFDAFYTTKQNGMGMGLSVSRAIIDSHQGKLWAEPNDGPGATFSFTIPCWRKDRVPHAARVRDRSDAATSAPRVHRRDPTKTRR